MKQETQEDVQLTSVNLNLMGTGKFTQSDKLVSGSQICVGCFADNADVGHYVEMVSSS